jgi:hypothetical protein
MIRSTKAFSQWRFAGPHCRVLNCRATVADAYSSARLQILDTWAVLPR